MLTKIAAATLFLTFVLFVNLAAVVTASFNRAETSTVASIAGLFQVVVDVGAVVLVVAVVVRWLMKQAWTAGYHPPQPARRPVSRPAHAPNPAMWNAATAQPLPFEDHAPAAYHYTTAPLPQHTDIQPPQGVLTDNIRRMRQQRDGYRIAR